MFFNRCNDLEDPSEICVIGGIVSFNSVMYYIKMVGIKQPGREYESHPLSNFSS